MMSNSSTFANHSTERDNVLLVNNKDHCKFGQYESQRLSIFEQYGLKSVKDKIE